MMEVFAKVVADLQSKLQLYIPLKLSWSWTCLKLLKLLSNYPSGVTDAIILSELHSEAERTRGKLTSSHSHHCKISTVDSVLDLKTVSYESVLEVYVSTYHNITDTSTKVIHIANDVKDGRHMEMYLHRKFYHMLDVLTTHSLRMTCCRLVSGIETKGQKTKLRLLPTEHVVILLDPLQEQTVKDTMKFTAIWPAVQDITQPQYLGNVFAKLMEIGQEEVINSPDGTVFRRVILQLDYNSGTHVPLVLWDSFVGFAKLFDQGDSLYIERPYAKPSVGGQFCLEYGPGTVFYAAPYKLQEEIVPSQHPTREAPILVTKTDTGKLDFLSYPNRLMIVDLVPSIINAVMLLQVTVTSLSSSNISRIRLERVCIDVRDQTGESRVVLLGLCGKSLKNLRECQWLVLSGLETVENDGELSLLCDLSKEGAIYNVEALQGWHTSQCSVGCV